MCAVIENFRNSRKNNKLAYLSICFFFASPEVFCRCRRYRTRTTSHVGEGGRGYTVAATAPRSMAAAFISSEQFVLSFWKRALLLRVIFYYSVYAHFADGIFYIFHFCLSSKTVLWAPGPVPPPAAPSGTVVTMDCARYVCTMRLVEIIWSLSCIFKLSSYLHAEDDEHLNLSSHLYIHCFKHYNVVHTLWTL